jgi:hypothetical protein
MRIIHSPRPLLTQHRNRIRNLAGLRHTSSHQRLIDDWL